MLRKICILILLILVLSAPGVKADALSQAEWAELQIFLDPVYPLMVDVYTTAETEGDVWAQALTELFGEVPSLEEEGYYTGESGEQLQYFYYTVSNPFAGQPRIRKTLTLDYAPLLPAAQSLELDELWLYETVLSPMPVNLEVAADGEIFSLGDSQWLDTELFSAGDTRVTYTILPEWTLSWLLLPLGFGAGWVLLLFFIGRQVIAQHSRGVYLASAVISVIVLVPVLEEVMDIPSYLLGEFAFFPAAAFLIVAGFIPRMVIMGGFTALQWRAAVSKGNLLGKLLLQWAKIVPLTMAAAVYLAVQLVSVPAALGLTAAAAAAVYLLNMAVERGYCRLISPEPVQDPFALSQLEKLCRSLSLPVPGLYLVDEYTGISGSKAFCQNMRNSGIYFQSSAYPALTAEEREFVLAHEAAHIHLGHLSKIYFWRQLSGVLFIVFSALCGLLGWLGLPGVVVLLGIRIKMGRWALARELETDALAVSLTEKPEAAIAALDKMAGERIKNRADLVKRKQALNKQSQGEASNPA